MNEAKIKQATTTSNNNDNNITNEVEESESSQLLINEKPATRKQTGSKLRACVNSQMFHLLSIVLTVFALLFAFISKRIFERNVEKKDTVSHYVAFSFSSVYVVLSFWFCVEVTVRMILNGKHYFWREGKGLRSRNVFELIIVWLSFFLDIYAYSQLVSSIRHVAQMDQVQISTLFGSITALRFCIYLLATPPMHGLVRNMKMAVESIVIVLLFCACLLYGASLLSFFLFNPNLFHAGDGKECNVCRERFHNIQTSFFAMLQVISADGFIDDIVHPLCEESSFSNAFIWLYFGFFECFTLFILLNVFTGVIMEGIVPRSDTFAKKKSNFRLLKDFLCGPLILSKYISERQKVEGDPPVESKLLNRITGDVYDEDEEYVDYWSFSNLPSQQSQRHEQLLAILNNMSKEIVHLKKEVEQLKVANKEE